MSMDVFKPLLNIVKFKLDKVSIDNNVFRLHYRATTVVMFACAIIVGTKEYAGDPIQCLTDDKLPDRVINVYCWIHPTYTLPERNGRVGVEVAHPGLGTRLDDEEVLSHKYYQWVLITLFFQAILFYIPRYVWKVWEAGRMQRMCKDLFNPVMSDESRKENSKTLSSFVYSHFHRQNLYAMHFFICEILNFVNVTGQLFLMNRFFDGHFFQYGAEVLKCATSEAEECSNPMTKFFPKVTKCTFHKFGASGSIEERDALCVLAINVVNEKVYIFLWCWLIPLSAISGLMVLYRVSVIMSLKVRKYLLKCRVRSISCYDLDTIIKEANIGDWFVLYQLSKNIDSLIFNDVLVSLAKKCREKHATGYVGHRNACKSEVLTSGKSEVLTSGKAEVLTSGKAEVLTPCMAGELTQKVYCMAV